MNYEMRLPGYGGAGVFLRRTAAREPACRKAIDIWLLAPDFCKAVLGRATESALLPDLARYLFTVASSATPERDLPSFADTTAGLSIDVGTSDEVRVGLRVRVADDPDADVVDYLDIDFETSRAALVVAAEGIAAVAGGMDLADFGGLD
ncbi:MAG: hypothetical protein DLM57_09330 [Pseudonocardiales bacterium]|nr:MAG: hypothetical protein DLM57_09330 [Pseudonocardiales bacterium]